MKDIGYIGLHRYPECKPCPDLLGTLAVIYRGTQTSGSDQTPQGREVTRAIECLKAAQG